MTIPTFTPPPTPGPNKYGGDPVAFDAAMQARLDWQNTATAEEVAMVAWVNTTATTVAAQSAAAQADRILVQQAKTAIDAQSPVANAAAAAASAAAAAAYAATAQAVSPDSPFRLNTNRIATSFTIPDGQNALTVGPFEVGPEVTVTGLGNSTWRGL